MVELNNRLSYSVLNRWLSSSFFQETRSDACDIANRWRLAGNRNRAVLPRRTVDGLNGRHVTQTFHSIGLRVVSLVNRFCECIEFKNKFVNHFEFLLEPSAPDLAKKTAFLFESEGRIQRCPAQATVDLHK